MSKILFINGNAYGHINPTLALVKELTNSGEEILYFSTEEFREKIETAGAGFISYGEKLNNFFEGFKPTGNHPFYTLVEFMLKMDEVVIPIILEKVEDLKFDYIIHDSMFGGGRVIAEKLGLPAICSCTSFAMNTLPLPPSMLEPGFHPQLDNLYLELEQAAKVWGLDSLKIMDIFFKKESLNLVYTSKLFQPGSEAFDNSFKFVGPSILERNEKISFPLEALQDTKVIYISMGTINNDCTQFYQICMEAFAGENVKVVMAVGNKIDVASLGRIPENFILKNYVPQLEVLQKTDAFISHGGLNSVSEALFFGVPVAAIPRANDQPMVARQLTALGAGIGLKMEEVTTRILKDTVRKLIEEDSYKAASRRIGDSFRKAGGYKAAVEYVLEFGRQ